MGRAPGASLRKIRTVEELQQHITEVWERLDERVMEKRSEAVA